MTLSSIRSMFAPGTVWKCDRTMPWANQKGAYRIVQERRGSELLWNHGHASLLHTRWPKASEVLEARPGFLSFRYEDHPETISFTLLHDTEAERIGRDLAAMRDAAIKATQHQKSETKRQREEAERKERADLIATIESQIRKGKPITGHQLVDILRHHGTELTPGTIGALRNKVLHVEPHQYAYRRGKKPRFARWCPVNLYQQIQALLTPPEPERSPAPADDLPLLLDL